MAKSKPEGEKQRGKDAKQRRAAGGEGAGLSLASHPRARRGVRRTRAAAGLAAFALAAYLSLQAGVPADAAAERALLAGVTGYMVGWVCGVIVWRHLVLAEVRLRRELSGRQPPVPTTVPAPAAASAEGAMPAGT
jgi:hypothetical protein